MRWVNILHAYQPPDWDPKIIRRVARESYLPLTQFLLDHPTIKITLNLAGSLTEQLAAHRQGRILQNLKTLIGRGQVECMMMPKYHPIIPFLTDEELRSQVEANAIANRKALGTRYQPKGFFPPELACDIQTGTQAESLGARWIVLDELAYEGRFTTVNPEQHFRWTDTDLRVLFRNRRVSDYLAFKMSPGSVGSFSELMKTLQVEGETVVTAMDAENLGHHRPGADRAWQQLITQPDVETLTVSALLAFPSKTRNLTPVPSSWSTDNHDLAKKIPYPLWKHPENPVHSALHRLYNETREVLLVHREHPGYTEARLRLDRAQASDVFWWASMRPWWDAPIVLRESAELYHAIDPLRLAPNPLDAAWEHVQAITNEWETTGQATVARTRYVELHKPSLFFAGQHIS